MNRPILFSAPSVMALCTLLIATGPVFARANEIDLSKPVSQSITPDGVYWTFDEGTVGSPSPANVSDGSGNGIEGRLIPMGGEAAPVYVEGRFGTAIKFGGAAAKSDEPNPRIHWNARDSGDETKLDMAGVSFTGGAWVQLGKGREAEENRMVVFERGESSGKQSYYSFVLQKNNSGAWAFVLSIGGEEPANIVSSERTDLLEDGKWHHVAFTFRSGGDASFVMFWIDGQPLGSERRTAARVPEITNPRERQFSAGERNVGYFYGFNGTMDDLFVTTGEHTFVNGTH